MKNLPIIALMALSLSACAATGERYSPPTVQSGTAQLIIYRPSAIILGGVSAEVEVSGESKCDLSVSGYMVENISPGKTVVAVDTWQLPGTSKLAFNAKAGNKYYVRVSTNNNKAGLRAMGGIIASEAFGDQGGPFKVVPVDAATAIKELQETRKTCN